MELFCKYTFFFLFTKNIFTSFYVYYTHVRANYLFFKLFNKSKKTIK